MTDTRHDTDVAFIQALANLLKANDLSELEVHRDYGENDSLNVRVSRNALPVAPQIAVSPQPAAPEPAAAPAPPAPEPEDPAGDPGAVPSPMVGTVYLQAEPGSDPFVTAGQKVSEGQTLLIVEAMKTMNQIPSPRSGVVREILVEDGAPVEFGAPLVIID